MCHMYRIQTIVFGCVPELAGNTYTGSWSIKLRTNPWTSNIYVASKITATSDLTQGQ